MLEYLNEERERADEASLNRLVLVIGVFGIIQAAAALVDLWGQWSATEDWTLARSAQFSVWIVASVFSVILIAFTAGTLSRRGTALMRRFTTRIPLPSRVRTLIDDIDEPLT